LNYLLLIDEIDLLPAIFGQVLLPLAVLEADGRRQAERLHLEMRGTLGILERGARLGRIDLRRALSRLGQTTFRMSPAVRAALLKRNP